ncbi:MAG: cytochrome P450 [Tabrizicola sp.]|uniref:cytochrome P450 n=1 Tax=Tabrizicola sp. TaxID=2005166 RepID=UPI002733975D|nr:cytochrome P450 [Tabrizicola sp.]MDP3262996.1 cytochrome P450 [Tabrizicola sp.]MDP3649335.1 cytochrome P450 [Paracoccaceae bacterium]MDZ4068169.1 cytochrome P450 [Tabrizicola sp.]
MQRLVQSPTEPGFVQDPYPFYERARAAGPFFHWVDYDLACTGNAAAVNAIFRDRRFGREAPEPLPVPPHLAPFHAVEAHSMLELEPPRHTRLRSLVLRAFTSRRIAALEPEIAGLSHTLIDRFPAGPFDLLQAFGQPLPVVIIARLLGVPEAMAPDLLRWSNAMVGMYQAGRTPAMEATAIAATEAFVAFLTGYIEERRARPADDLITSLIAAEMEGERLSTEELISTCILLLNAGHEATVHTIGNGVKTLLETGTKAALLADPQATVEEVLRFDPALHMFTRWVYEEVEVMGHTFKRGDRVALMLAAANRDPGVWEEPGRFWPERRMKANVSFGAGLHFCVGAPLARLELQTALPILFQRMPGLRLVEPPRYGDVYHFHGLKSLIVRG